MSTLVVSLISETCESLSAVSTFEGAVSRMCSWMHFEVPLFGEAFVTALERAEIDSFRSDSVLIRFVNSQSILSGKTLRAESAIEKRWTVLSHLWRWNCFMIIQRLKIIASIIVNWCLLLMIATFLVTGWIRVANWTFDMYWFTGIKVVFFLLRF
jgi:hypothetical protein